MDPLSWIIRNVGDGGDDKGGSEKSTFNTCFNAALGAYEYGGSLYLWLYTSPDAVW